MKCIGIVLINLSTFYLGISYANKLKMKLIISSELIQMCDLLKIEIGYMENDTKEIITKLSKENSLSNLIFLKNLEFENINIKTQLNENDNEKLNLLFKNLGGLDIASTIALIDGFRQSIIQSNKKYKENYETHAKLYIALGLFSGLTVSLILI